jgi:hypothetical protein
MPLVDSILGTLDDDEIRQNAYCWAFHYYLQRIRRSYTSMDERIYHAAKLGSIKATRRDNGLPPKTYGAPRRSSVRTVTAENWDRLVEWIEDQQHVARFHKLFAE